VAVQEDGARRLAANTAWLIGAQVVGKLASFAFIVIVARGLGTEQFGYFSFALSFVPLFLALGGFGLESTIIRGVARDPGRVSALFATGLALRTGLGIAGLLASLAVAPFLVEGGDAFAAVAIVGAALLADELTGFVGTIFRAFERMKFHALAVVVNRIVSTVLAVAAVAAGGGLVVVCLTYLAGSVGALAFAAALLRRAFAPIDVRAVSRAEARELARKGGPLGLAGILNTGVFRIDSVLLQAIRGAVEVGLYGVAYRLFESLLFLAWSLGNAALPRLSRGRQPSDLRRLLVVTVAAALAFYLAFVAAVPFASTWIVTTLFSARYEDAAPAVALLIGATAPYAVAYLSRIAAIALGLMREVAVIAAMTFALNVGLNLYAIPEWGFEGAAGVTLATALVEAILLTALVARAGAGIGLGRATAAPVVAAACVAAALAAGGFDGGTALAVGALFYPAALAATAYLFAADEARIAVGLLQRRPRYG
jgi:O-antigen/teichoic acid export membrane protein